MAIAFVQDISDTSGGSTTLVLTQAASLTTGNGSVVWVGWNDQAITISSVTGGGTYDTAFTKYDDTLGNNWSIQGFFCKNITSAVAAITITFSSAPSICTAYALEFSGQDTTTQPDAASTGRSQNGIDGTVDLVATNNCTTVANNAVVVGFAARMFSAITQMDAGTGMTAAEVNVGDATRSRVDYVTKVTAGAQSMLFTATGAGGSCEVASGAFSITPSAGGGSQNSIAWIIA